MNHTRLPSLDIARTLAISQMIAYHAVFDLDNFGWIHVSMLSDPFWIGWRTLIVSQFLLIMGIASGLDSAVQRGVHWKRFAQTAGCALLVSAASAWLFGPRWIWFGVLHFACVTQLVTPVLRRLGTVMLCLGAALAIAISASVTVPAFTAPGLAWIGLLPAKPATEDYVPLLPWLGAVAVGMTLSRPWVRLWRRFDQTCGATRAGRWLGLPGRWPLTAYMVHQPVLFGILSVSA